MKLLHAQQAKCPIRLHEKKCGAAATWTEVSDIEFNF